MGADATAKELPRLGLADALELDEPDVPGEFEPTPLIEKIGRAHLRFAQEVLLKRGDQFSHSRCVGLGWSTNDHAWLR